MLYGVISINFGALELAASTPASKMVLLMQLWSSSNIEKFTAFGTWRMLNGLINSRELLGQLTILEFRVKSNFASLEE
jgi:hypothetical protein